MRIGLRGVRKSCFRLRTGSGEGLLRFVMAVLEANESKDVDSCSSLLSSLMTYSLLPENGSAGIYAGMMKHTHSRKLPHSRQRVFGTHDSREISRQSFGSALRRVGFFSRPERLLFLGFDRTVDAAGLQRATALSCFPPKGDHSQWSPLRLFSVFGRRSPRSGSIRLLQYCPPFQRL
jgi:hypothetical protein